MISGGFWDTQLIIQFIVVVAIPCYDLRLLHTLSVMLCYKGITGITQFPVGPAPSAPSAYAQLRRTKETPPRSVGESLGASEILGDSW